MELRASDLTPRIGSLIQTDLAALAASAGQDLTALVIQQPNFFGVLEDVDALTDWAHAQGALVIAVVNPTALALLKAPGQWGQRGADIVVGDGQPLGCPLSSGGPYFGFMATRQEFVRQMPGRIVGCIPTRLRNAMSSPSRARAVALMCRASGKARVRSMTASRFRKSSRT